MMSLMRRTMPLKPHPDNPDKMVYVSRQYDMPDTPTAKAYLKKVLDDDDDIQVYKRPWVSLTDEEIKEIVGPWGDTPIKGYTRKLFDQIEAKLKEKNT